VVLELAKLSVCPAMKGINNDVKTMMHSFTAQKLTAFDGLLIRAANVIALANIISVGIDCMVSMCKGIFCTYLPISFIDY
jgi:hypothetical protein